MDRSSRGATAPHSQELAPSTPAGLATDQCSVDPRPTSSAPLPARQIAIVDDKDRACDTTQSAIQVYQASATGAKRVKRNARMTVTKPIPTARPASRRGVPSHATVKQPIDIDATDSERRTPKSRLRPSPRSSTKRRMQDRDSDGDEDGDDDDDNNNNEDADYQQEEEEEEEEDDVLEIDYDEHSSDYESNIITKARPPPAKKQKRNKGETCLACARAGQATECAKRPCSFLKGESSYVLVIAIVVVNLSPEELATPDDHALPAFVRKLNDNFALVIEYLERIQDIYDSLDTRLCQAEDLLHAQVSAPSEPRPRALATLGCGAKNFYGPAVFFANATDMPTYSGVADQQRTPGPVPKPIPAVVIVNAFPAQMRTNVSVPT
ncbi:hypothetical protein L226DRAFT_525958 [Lentinus tigrinus ALCF2SS1-7]|uniref:uncharacterized protein n=1 Tax=Lentinus tigrinus ALCF2SS1-7 TaxID=1328758 RepID=UPI0011661B60|nr:hypothetical protein L226DRAFT_525958 [Lentinus tigrinus ALCF2SS1-7]